MDATAKLVTPVVNSEKAKALQAALAQIEKQFGKGTIMSSRLAFTSFRSSGAMLTSSICGIVWSRSRICRPVVPASPSMKTLAICEYAWCG